MYIHKCHTANHIQLVVQLAEEIWHEHFTPIIGKGQVAYMLDKYQSYKAIEAQIKKGYLYFIAFEQEKPIGYCAIRQDSREKIFLSKLYLKKSARKKGYSRKMLYHAIEKCQCVFPVAIYLQVNKDNEDTINVYKKLGFKIIDSSVTDIGEGFVMDDFKMELQLHQLP